MLVRMWQNEFFLSFSVNAAEVQQVCGVIQEVGQLFSELEDITDWHIIVEDLGLRVTEVFFIEEKYSDPRRRQREALRAWYQGSAQPQWRDVVRVLVRRKHIRTAKGIAERYGCKWAEFEVAD